jgi:hypothetical protein
MARRGAPLGNKNSAGYKNHLEYKPEYNEMARRYFLLNASATEEQLAKFFDVTSRTISNWKNAYPEFKQAVREGKELADTEVVNALHQRAVGYKHPAVKIMYHPDQKEIISVPYTEHYPPDTGAAKMWLTNRSKQWKDKQVVEIEDPDDLLARVLGVDKDKLPE